MGSVNVNRNLSDQFYRYKMPKLIAKVEGKGNGIKTVIVNMTDVAKALNRPPTYPTKFFGCELGAQTQFDIKNDRFIVNGSHEAAKLQDLLDSFIKRYVLCPECENPETVLGVINKKNIITTECKACGYSGHLDSTHKLTTFIMKNPPDQDTAPGASVQSGKKSKRKSKEEKGHKKQNGDSGSPQNNSDDDWGTTEDNKAGDDEWSAGTDAKSVAERLKLLSAGAKGLTLTDELEKTPQERLDSFYNFVKGYIENSKLDSSQKEISHEADRLEIKDKAPLVLCELLFNDNMIQQIKNHRILFLRFTHENQKAQKCLLGGFEQVVQIHRDSLMSRVPTILKALYDADILEEEVILDWSKKVSKKYVSKEIAQEIHDKAKPFIKWLQEAEEESSSGEEDEDKEAVEVVYCDRHHGSILKEVKTNNVSQVEKMNKNANEEDDIDIDAI